MQDPWLFQRLGVLGFSRSGGLGFRGFRGFTGCKGLGCGGSGFSVWGFRGPGFREGFRGL